MGMEEFLLESIREAIISNSIQEKYCDLQIIMNHRAPVRAQNINICPMRHLVTMPPRASCLPVTILASDWSAW